MEIKGSKADVVHMDELPLFPVIGILHRVGIPVGDCFDFVSADWGDLTLAVNTMPEHKSRFLTAAPERLDRLALARDGRLVVWDQLDDAIVGAVWPGDDPVLVYDFDAVIRELLVIMTTSDWEDEIQRQEEVTRWFHDEMWVANFGDLTPLFLLRNDSADTQ